MDIDSMACAAIRLINFHTNRANVSFSAWLILLLATQLPAVAVAAQPPLMIPPQPGRQAQSDADWVNMIPMSGTAADFEFCDSPVFVAQTSSLDGGYLYQEVCRWVTSNYIVQVRLSDGRRRGVIDGNNVRVIRDGPWRGYLLLERHKYRESGAYDATDVVRPDGHVELTVPGTLDGTDQGEVEGWLQRNGWRAW